jgi:hypothetical protein
MNLFWPGVAELYFMLTPNTIDRCYGGAAEWIIIFGV